jgi:flagellar biosynthesis chaperone FliJ
MGSQFTYRLQVLLDRKEDAKKQAERELARIEQEREAEVAKLRSLELHEKSLRERREQLRRDLFNKPAEGDLTAIEIMRRSEYLKEVGTQIEEAKANVLTQMGVIEECDIRVKQATQKVAEARREVEVLTKHRSKQEERFVRELQAKEELALDEVGNVLYTIRRQPL